MSDIKINEDYKRSEEFQAYIDMMVKERASFKAPKPSTAQAASTQRVLEMTDTELAAYRNRTIDMSKAYKEPIDWSRINEDEYIDKLVAARRLSIEDIIRYEDMRRGAKNQLGESKKSIASDEQKEAARQAFTCTPSAPLTEVQFEKVTRAQRIKELEDLSVEKASSSILDWFKRKLFGPESERLSYAELQEWFKDREDKEKK